MLASDSASNGWLTRTFSGAGAAAPLGADGAGAWPLAAGAGAPPADA